MSTEKNNLRIAIFAIISAVFVASLSDAYIKFVSAGFQLWQIFVLRSLLTIPILFGIIKLHTPSISVIPVNVGWTALRSLMLVFMWVTYYMALPKVDLSVAAAVYYTLPLFITLFAAVFVGEKVGVKGWMAVALGFFGVLLILRPQADDFNAYSLLPLTSAILYALAMILTRTKIRYESALVLSLSLNMAFVVVGTIGTLIVILYSPGNTQTEYESFLFGEWITLGYQEWLTIVILAILITTGSQLATIAYQNGPSSMVSSFDFFYLMFVVMWGIIFFKEVPDVTMLIGIVLITTAGIIAIRK